MNKRLSYGLVGGLFLLSGCTSEGQPMSVSTPTSEAIMNVGVIINTQIEALDLNIFSTPESKDDGSIIGIFRFGQAAVALCLHTPKLDDEIDRQQASMIKIHDYDAQEGYVEVYPPDGNSDQMPHFQLDYDGFKQRIPACGIV